MYLNKLRSETLLLKKLSVIAEKAENWQFCQEFWRRHFVTRHKSKVVFKWAPADVTDSWVGANGLA